MCEETYKNFDLNNFGKPEKAMAIIEYLDLDGEIDTIREENEETYYINEKKVKRGTSPKDYKKEIKIFKTLLTKKDIEDITSIINLGKKCSKETRDKVYYNLDKKIIRKVERKKDNEDIKWLLSKSLYVQNVLYHLLDNEDKDYILCYREAWLNKRVKDRRTDDTEYQEYLILTDDEADTKARESLEVGEIWMMAVQAGNTTSSLDDWIDDVLNIDGRANELNRYDGTEYSETINGTDYYIYRQN